MRRPGWPDAKKAVTKGSKQFRIVAGSRLRDLKNCAGRPKISAIEIFGPFIENKLAKQKEFVSTKSTKLQVWFRRFWRALIVLEFDSYNEGLDT